MRDLCEIFDEVERGYKYPEFEDNDLPFDKVLEIVEQSNDIGFDDEWDS